MAFQDLKGLKKDRQPRQGLAASCQRWGNLQIRSGARAFDKDFRTQAKRQRIAF